VVENSVILTSMFSKISNQNHILQYDNLLSTEDSTNIKNWFLKKGDIKKATDRVGYYYNDYQRELSIPDTLKPMIAAIDTLGMEYTKRNPELNTLANKCIMPAVRFKWWKPGDAYSSWHCEHSHKFNNRVLGFMIYLSDNNSATEFYRYGKSRATIGRAIMFPAGFTHTHRGTPCKDQKDRYALSGYYFITEELNENTDLTLS